MFEDAIDSTTRKSLALLNDVPLVKGFYLAGGTATALQLGHRLSFDLDFFSPKGFDHKNLVEELSKKGSLEIEQSSPDTFLGALNKHKISFFRYPYPLLFPTKKLGNIKIADLRDIAVMKIDAVSRRGKKRDFIDLYFIVKEISSLKNLLVLFDQKFANLNINKFHIVKSLNYFDDAEADPAPQMIKPVDWSEVKKFFEGQVKKIAKDEGII